jgi:thioredoxin 1
VVLAAPGKAVVVHATDKTFDAEVMNAKVPVLVDFYADWCGPCKMMAPELQKLAEKYPGGIKVVKVNAEENPGMADRYQVHAYPTLVLFNHGQKLQQESGARNLDGLVSWVQAKVKLSSGSAVVVAKPAADSATPVTTQTAREIEALAVELLNSPELKNATGNAILGQAMGNWAEQLLNRISGQAAPVGQDLQNLALASTLAAHNKAALTRDRSYEATEKTLLPALQKVTDKTSYVQMVSALAGVLSHIPLNATEENDKANGGRFNEEKRYAPLRDQLVTGLRNLLKQGPAWSDDVEVLRATLLLQPFLQIAVNLPKTPEKMVALLNDPDIAVQREAAALVPQTAEANPALLQADGPNQALWKSFAGFTQQLVTEGHQSQGNGLRAENLDYMLAMARTTLLAIMHNPKLADTLFAKDENMRHLFHDALILSSKLRLGQDQTRLDPFWLDMQKLIDRADLNASQRNSFGGLVFDYLCARIAIQSALDKYHVGKLADRTKIRDEIYSHLAGPRVDTSNVAGEARVVANEVSVDFGVRKEGARFLDPDTLFDALTTVEHEIGHTTGKFYWELGPAKDLANRTLETMVGPDKVDDRSLFGSEVRSITVVRLGFVRYQSNYEDILRSRDTKSVRLPWTSGRSDFPAQGLKAFQSDRPLFQIYTEMFNAHPEMDPQIQLLYLLLKGEKLEEPNLVDPAKVKTWSDVTRQLRSLEKQGEAYLPGSMWSGYLVGGVGVDSGDIWHTPEIAAELMTKIAFQFEPAVAESIAYATADFMQKGPVRVDMAAAIRKAVPDADPGMVDKWLEHYTRTWSRGQLAYSPEQTRSVLRQVLAKRLGKAAKDITDEVLLKQAARADVKAAAQLLAEQLRQSWKQSQAPQQMQKAIPDSYLPVANPGLPADLIQEMIIQHLRAKDDPPLFVQQETKLPAQTKIAGAEATTKEHGYGIAAARVSRSLQIVLGVLVQIALALLSSPLGDLAKGDWGSFAWKAGVMVLAALFSLVSVAVAQNRVWMIKNYMPQGELAVSVGPLSEGQLAALAKLKNSPWPVEQRLYQLILLHESYQSHFFGTLVMNPVMGRFFQWFLPPDNYLVDRGSLVLRGQAIDRAVAEYSQKTEAQVASVQIPERGATGLGIEPQGQQPGVRWNEPILYRLPGWLQFRPILYLSLFFQGLRLNPFRQFSRSLAGAPILPGSRNEINAQLALSPTLRAIIETVVPQIPAEIQKVGRVSIQPVAARKVGDLFLGNHRLVTGQHPELVLQLPGSILNALLWGETSSATPEELSRYAQARELAMMIVANQVRLYCRETTGVTQKTMASKYSYSAIDQDLAAKLEEQQPKVWEKGDALSEKEALVKRLESGRINITRTELTAYFRELMRDVDQAMAGIYLPADAQLASIRKARRTDQVDRGRSELYDALKARLEAGEDITADALLNILQMHAFDNDVQLALLNLQLKNARSALAAAQTPAERRQAQQALRETENGIVYNMMGLLAVSRPALTMEEADFVSKSRAQEVNVESLNPVEKGEILKALDRATEGLKFSSDEATKQALNARIVALRNALLLSQFMSYNPADAKQVLVKGVMAARLGMAGATVELSNTATHLEKPNGSRVYLAVAGQKEVTTKAGVISTPTLLEINTKADIGAISAQVKQGAVHVESDGADVVLSGILRLLGLHQWAGALSFWLRELAYKNAPSLVLGRVIAKLKQDKSMAIVLSQSQLKPYLPQDGQSLSDYLNSSDPLPTALRALALHPSPQTRDQVSKTLLRIIRPHQLTAWNGALMESNTADWLVFSAFIGNMGCIPSVEIAQATNHVVWTKAGFTSFSQVKLAVPAVLLNLRGTRGWLGFVTDRLSHPDSPFEVRQDVIDMFLRRGIMRFSSAA